LGLRLNRISSYGCGTDLLVLLLERCCGLLLGSQAGLERGDIGIEEDAAHDRSDGSEQDQMIEDVARKVGPERK
jgi:hypothetical protein